MKTIDNDIKAGEFKKVYLLYGEERYLIRQYRDKLIKAMVKENDTMNFSSFEGDGISQKEIIDLAETLPFFADRRVILIEDAGIFKKTGDELGEYLQTAPDTTHFIFVEESVDKRSRIYKAAAKCGNPVEFKTQTDETLARWVGTRIRKEGKDMSRAAYNLFISKTGTDMENIDKELEKLICYCMDKEVIEIADVEAITTEQIQNKIFDMVEAVAMKNQKKALDYYYDLLALKEPPMRILYLLTRQFKLLLEVKDLVGKRYDKSSIAKTVGLHPFVAGKYMQQCRTFEKKELRNILEEAVDTEEMVKTGRLNDVMSVELFIVKYSAA